MSTRKAAARDSHRLRIGQFAGKLELNPRTLRFYEQCGLLPEPDRTEAGYRLYGEEDLRRVRFIKSAQRAGLSLGEIREILALRDRGEAPCEYVADTIERRLSELDRQIAELRKLKRELRQLSARAKSLGAQPAEPGGYCHILEPRSGWS